MKLLFYLFLLKCLLTAKSFPKSLTSGEVPCTRLAELSLPSSPQSLPALSSCSSQHAATHPSPTYSHSTSAPTTYNVSGTFQVLKTETVQKPSTISH